MDIQESIKQFEQMLNDSNLKFDMLEGKKTKGGCVFDSDGNFSRPTIVTAILPEKGEHIVHIGGIGTKIKRVKIIKITNVIRTEEEKLELDPLDPLLYMSCSSIFDQARNYYYDWLEIVLEQLKYPRKETEEDWPKLGLGESSRKKIIEMLYEKRYLSCVPQFEVEAIFNKKFEKSKEAKSVWVKMEGKEMPFKFGAKAERGDLVVRMTSKKLASQEIEKMEIFRVGSAKRETETILDWQDGRWVKEPKESEMIDKMIGEAMCYHVLILWRASGLCGM